MMTYWERMKYLKMNSQQRRLERYRIIYMWKILEGKVPNCGVEIKTSYQKGRETIVPQLKPKLRHLRDHKSTNLTYHILLEPHEFPT